MKELLKRSGHNCDYCEFKRIILQLMITLFKFTDINMPCMANDKYKYTRSNLFQLNIFSEYKRKFCTQNANALLKRHVVLTFYVFL